jgi:hypothetical protein
LAISDSYETMQWWWGCVNIPLQLQYAIDEVYARYGAIFPHRPDNQREFEKCSWYHPNPNLSYEAIDQLMSDVERQNIKFPALCRELKRGK